MKILNILCPICTEVFENSDDIYSTSCGHIFHLSCMNEWRTRERSCPQCRHLNPTTHKLYLSFDDTEENPEKLQELELMLKSSNEKNAQLLDQMQETEFNFLHIQEQFTICEKSKRDLEERIRQMSDSEENFLNLQVQYTELSEHVKELQDQIQSLVIENEYKVKELNLKCLKIESLKAGLGTEQSTLTDNILSDKIRILEQKLKHISAEFEKEIQNSTQLSIEKMKLQSYVDKLKTMENTKENVQNQSCKEQKRRMNQKNENVMKNKKTNKASNHVNNAANCVFIKALPLDQLVTPLEKVVLNLASKMLISISPEDLVKVDLVKKNTDRSKSSNPQMFVEFKSNHFKTIFLSNKLVLKNDPSTSSILIEEYISDQLQSLLMYAREKLEKSGFSHIYYTNQQIFAKRHRNQRNGLRIIDKAHVDSLESGAAALAISNKNNIDENYYQL